MLRKVCVALIAVMFIAAIIPQSLAASDGVKPYKGMVGADSPFYGFKLFIQKADVSLTGDASVRLHKLILYGDERLAEACAMAMANNTGALQAALEEYARQMEAINNTMDDESIDDLAYLEAGEDLETQEDNLTDLINDSTISPAAQELMNQALNRAQEIKNGRPFISFNNTSYFIPPGQMKKLDWSHVPGGLAKKGYKAPAPVVIDGTVYWPWDEGYVLATDGTGNAKMPLNASEYTLPVVKQHGNGKDKANGKSNDNGNGKN